MGFKYGNYDFYDDGGELLRQVVSGPEDIPDFVKAASEIHQNSSSNRFALVLVDGEEVLKKFATADKGNTWLSLLYYSDSAERLPPEARKVAAANIVAACDRFEIEVPEPIRKFASQVEAGPNVVDVTGGQLPPKAVKPTEPSGYAIERADGTKYFPLFDTAESVRAADQYFQRHVGGFEPRERREYAVKVAALADRQGFPLSSTTRHYAGEEYGGMVDGYLRARRQFLNEQQIPALDKLAAERDKIAPQVFAELLDEFDSRTNLKALWDRNLPDPWYSTFAMPKTAKGLSPPPSQTFRIGPDTVTSTELQTLAERSLGSIIRYFGDEFANQFQTDPITQFEAAPLPVKKMLARLATETDSQSAYGH